MPHFGAVCVCPSLCSKANVLSFTFVGVSLLLYLPQYRPAPMRQISMYLYLSLEAGPDEDKLSARYLLTLIAEILQMTW